MTMNKPKCDEQSDHFRAPVALSFTSHQAAARHTRRRCARRRAKSARRTTVSWSRRGLIRIDDSGVRAATSFPDCFTYIPI